MFLLGALTDCFEGFGVLQVYRQERKVVRISPRSRLSLIDAQWSRILRSSDSLLRFNVISNITCSIHLDLLSGLTNSVQLSMKLEQWRTKSIRRQMYMKSETHSLKNPTTKISASTSLRHTPTTLQHRS